MPMSPTNQPFASSQAILLQPRASQDASEVMERRYLDTQRSWSVYSEERALTQDELTSVADASSESASLSSRNVFHKRMSMLSYDSSHSPVDELAISMMRNVGFSDGDARYMLSVVTGEKPLRTWFQDYSDNSGCRFGVQSCDNRVSLRRYRARIQAVMPDHVTTCQMLHRSHVDDVLSKLSAVWPQAEGLSAKRWHCLEAIPSNPAHTGWRWSDWSDQGARTPWSSSWSSLPKGAVRWGSFRSIPGYHVDGTPRVTLIVTVHATAVPVSMQSSKTTLAQGLSHDTMRVLETFREYVGNEDCEAPSASSRQISETACEFLRYSVGLVDDAFQECMDEHAGGGESGGGSTPEAFGATETGDGPSPQDYQNAYWTCYAKMADSLAQAFLEKKLGQEGGCIITTKWV